MGRMGKCSRDRLRQSLLLLKRQISMIEKKYRFIDNLINILIFYRF